MAFCDASSSDWQQYTLTKTVVFCLSLSLCLPGCLAESVCLPVCLPVFLPLCLPASLSVFLCLSVCVTFFSLSLLSLSVSHSHPPSPSSLSSPPLLCIGPVAEVDVTYVLLMLSVGEAPTVLEGLPDLAVMEGDTTIFECKISGEPLPSIRWLVS